MNKLWWNEAFDFFNKHNLKTLPVGKYVVDSGNVFATVWEGMPKVKDSVMWEAHHDFNDLQYIITGTAEMGVAPIDDPDKTVTVPYIMDQDIAHYQVNAGDSYYKADSTTFFIFSPLEMHRPAIQSTDRMIKKIVIKVRVPR
jgi:YhcH/YjgK/YiaL family protein